MSTFNTVMTSDASEFLGVFSVLLLYVLLFAIIIFLFIGTFRMYKKAGKKGWECLIPIYSQIMLLDIAEQKRNWVWLWIVCVSITSLPFDIFVGIELAKRFNRSQGFGVIVGGFLPMLAYAIIGFDKSTPYKPLHKPAPKRPSKSPLAT